MNQNEYQTLALRTEFTPDFVRLVDRQTGEPMSPEHNMMIARLLHAMLGIASEAGELADALKKHIIYGKQLDTINVMEETGDLTWYEAIALHACKYTFEEAMERNIAKLKKRFGEKFSEVNALVRDLTGERATLEAGPSESDPLCEWCGGSGVAGAVHITETAHGLLHTLWSKAVGTEGYVKEEWRQLARLIESQTGRR